MYARLCGIVALSASVGCYPPSTTIESRRDPQMADKVSRLFVVSQVGSDAEVSSDAFERALIKLGESCGLRVGISSQTRLELDPKVHAERMHEFGASYVLALAVTGHTVQGQTVLGTEYDARLFRESEDKLLWRARVRLWRGNAVLGDAADTLAHDLLGELSVDGVIQRCSSLHDPPRHGAQQVRY